MKRLIISMFLILLLVNVLGCSSGIPPVKIGDITYTIEYNDKPDTDLIALGDNKFVSVTITVENYKDPANIGDLAKSTITDSHGTVIKPNITLNGEVTETSADKKADSEAAMTSYQYYFIFSVAEDAGKLMFNLTTNDSVEPVQIELTK